MGTIAQKLEYLNDTRLLLKDNINKINNVLDDNSTFRSYPQELFNGYLDILNNGTDTLWNNLEKVSQTGTEAVLEGVETAPIKMVLNGNTSQETTTGKNLYKFEKSSSYLNGITAELMEDGGIHCYGTATENYSNISADFENVLVAGNYTISYIGEFPKVALRAFYTDGGYVDYSLTSSNNKLTINFEKEISKYRIALVTTKGQTYDGILYFQLEQGSTATSYEPYTGGQPSPSPDYPQQVKVVKGENVVSVSGKNKFNIDDILIGTKINDRTFTATHVNGKLIEMDFNPNLKYNIGFKITQDHESNGVFVRIKYTDETSVVMNSTSTDTVSKTILTTKAIQEILLQYSAYNTITTFEDFYIYEETTDTSYVPYSKTDYPINLGDIELCKINTYKDYFHKDSGKWYVHKEIGKVVLNGSENWSYISSSVLPFRTSISDMALNSTGSTTYNFFSNYYKAQSGSVNDYAIGQISGGRAICIRNVEISTLEDFKTWLSTHNTIVYYVLATPTEEEITNTTLISQLEAISKAKSVKDKTYITQTNEELPFILDVQAIKEYEVV